MERRTIAVLVVLLALVMAWPVRGQTNAQPLVVSLYGVLAGSSGGAVPITVSNPNVTGNFGQDGLAIRNAGYGTSCTTGNGCIPALTSAGTFTSATIMNYTDSMASTSCSAELRSSAGTGTTPTLNVYVQTSIDQANFHDRISFSQVTTSTSNQIAGIFNAAHMAPAAETDASLAAGSATDGPIPNAMRIKFVVGGTTPSFANVAVNIWCH